MDVIIRNEMVERVRPGDKAVFTGSLIVIPDMGAFQAPGERTLLQSHLPQTTAASGRGVSGISSTGSRELHYKLAFLANNIQVCPHISNMDAVTAVLLCPALYATSIRHSSQRKVSMYQERYVNAASVHMLDSCTF